MGKRIVITGGAGFIGSHLAEEMVRQGYQVVIFDNLSTGRIENVELCMKKGNVEFIQGDVTNLSLLRKVFQATSYVFHLAALASVPQSIENPKASHEVNVTGTLNVLIAAKERGVNRLVYASSSSVYGDTSTIPQREDILPNPQSPYAVTKLAGEHYCRVFQQVYRLPTICLRYFNVYGPRQSLNSQYSAVIPSFIKSASEGVSPIIFGDGEQTRDFIFVKDVVEANILAAESRCTGNVNVGTQKRVSIKRLAQLIINLTCSAVKPIYGEAKPGEVRHSLADIDKAKTLGYYPKYSLKEGLIETIANSDVGSSRGIGGNDE